MLQLYSNKSRNEKTLIGDTFCQDKSGFFSVWDNIVKPFFTQYYHQECIYQLLIIFDVWQFSQ